jgi:PAS domain S-box-containing protein
MGRSSTTDGQGDRKKRVVSFRPEHRADARVPSGNSTRQPYVAEECCRTIFEHAADVLALTNLEARVIAINPRVESLLGYAPAEVVGRKFTELPVFLPERLHTVARLFEAAVKRGDVAASAGEKRDTMEMPLRHKDGRVVWVETATTAIRSGTGLMGFLSSLRDVTDIRKTRGQLARALAWQEAIFDGPRDAALVTDGQLRFVAVNRAAVELTGYTRQELLHMSVPDLCEEQDIAVAGPVQVRVLAGAEVIKETSLRRKDGTTVDTELSLCRVKIGSKTYVHATARDVTDRKRKEQACRAIVENSLQGLAIFQEGRVAFVNQAMADISGYSIDEILRMTPEQVRAFVHPDDRQMVWDRHLQRLAGVPGPHRHEIRGIRKDGSICWLEIHATRIDYHGRPAVQVTYMDVTEHKQTEQQLLDYQRRLRELAASLTLAEERERRRIAVGVHDQIGQRLALVKLTLQSLSVSCSESSVVRTLKGVCKDIDQVLEDAHSLTFELSNPVLYEAGFADAVESWLARQVRDRHGTQYTFEASESGVDLNKEACVALFHVVRELLTNIIKHAKAKQVDVRIQRTGDAMQIVVGDDGVGFEPSEAGKCISRSGGFGLFNVREQLGCLGGSLRIESAPGKGTCVVVVVPLRHFAAHEGMRGST